MYLIRYADDFVITGVSRDLLENEVIPLVRDFLAQRGLALSEEKTVITPTEEGFDFLGFNLRRYGDKLLTTPSKKSVKRLLDRIREIVASGRIKSGNGYKLIDDTVASLLRSKGPRRPANPRLSGVLKAPVAFRPSAFANGRAPLSFLGQCPGKPDFPARRRPSTAMMMLQCLIDCLNPILLGWAYYYRHGASKSTFVRVDHEVWKCLWRWAQRRHPQKTKQWIKDRYFIRVGGQDWTFCDTHVDRERHLFQMARMLIRRHVKVWQDANPFAPAWRSYFAQRERKSWRPA